MLAKYIAKIIKDVATQGDKALSYYTLKYDKVKLSARDFRVSKTLIRASGKQLPADLRLSIERAAKNIRKFHLKEMSFSRKAWFAGIGGIKTGQIRNAVESAGIYVPGGRFPYPSTVLMSAIPARVAGVKRVIIATPPKNASPAVLYAAYCAGVDEVYTLNGPAAIAAMACGTKTIPKVDIIAGPGNAYINEAKRQVIGKVGIDSLAGPSEVAIIADSTAKPRYIAADILAQLEHDPDAKAYLFTNARSLIKTVNDIIKRNNGGYDLGRQYRTHYCTLEKAVSEANSLAPEHLELAVKHPALLAKKIRNAGAIFAGINTPTAIGDYWAGPSHVLPTGGAARFSGGISAATFIKKISYIECPASVIKKYGSDIERLAASEGLENHRKSIEIRTGKNLGGI